MNGMGDQRRRLSLSLLLSLALLLAPAAAMKQRWRFEREDRPQFLLERFGFGARGALDVHVSAVRVDYTGADAPLSSPEKAARDAQLEAGLLFVHVRLSGWCLWGCGVMEAEG